MVGRITPRGHIPEYPRAGSSPHGITTGPDSALWFCEFGGGRIGRITTSGHVTHFALAAALGRPRFIVTGRDGALWFNDRIDATIGRITVTGAVSVFTLPKGSAAGPHRLRPRGGARTPPPA